MSKGYDYEIVRVSFPTSPLTEATHHLHLTAYLVLRGHANHSDLDEAIRMYQKTKETP